MLLRHTPGDSDYDDIQQIRASSNRAASLTRQLLAFSRQQTLRPQVLQLPDIVTEITQMLRRLIGQRNAEHKQWGFKLPSLHTLMRHDEVGLFRNPHLIAIYRDPVAVAVRHAISEHADAASGLANTIGAMAALARFAEQAGCPTLFLSYEKVLSFPPLLVDSVLDFCGIAATAEQRAALLTHVEPNNPAYMAAASRRFMGRIDGIMDGELFGWCFEEGRLEPVTLEVYADDRLIETFVADGYRGD